MNSFQGAKARLHSNLVMLRHALHGQSSTVHAFGLRFLFLFFIDGAKKNVSVGISRIFVNEAIQYACSADEVTLLLLVKGQSKSIPWHVGSRFHSLPAEVHRLVETSFERITHRLYAA